VARERRSSRKPQNWPSVEEQLRESGVVHGSALEQLIRDNQDFELLHPDEVNDGLPIPPWLRVHWRKQHPEEVPDDTSPAAPYPYPDVLDSVYEWMRIHQDLPGWQPEGRSRGRRPTGRRPGGGGSSRGSGGAE
jgi:hypothetical protein